MEKEKKPRIKKMKTSKITMSSIAFVFLAFVLTLGLFFGLIIVQNFLSDEIVYKEIVVAKTDIPYGTVINMENAEEYLTLKQVNILDATENSLVNADSILNMRTKVALVKGEVIMNKDFEAIGFSAEEFQNPVEVSIDVSNISDADGGKLRAGDLINITMTYTKTQLGLNNTADGSYASGNGSNLTFEDILAQSANQNNTNSSNPYPLDKYAQYVMECVYVEKVLNSSGIEIANSDLESNASILVLIIDRDTEIEFNNALANGANLRISKILDKEAAKALKEKQQEMIETETEMAVEGIQKEEEEIEKPEIEVPEMENEASLFEEASEEMEPITEEEMESITE